jgi:hypothetical protein
VRGDEGVHKGLEVGAPPLRQRVADLPLIVDALACELRADRRKTLVQARLEALDLVVLCAKVVAGTGLCQRWSVVSSAQTYSLKKAFAICSMRM